MQGAGLLIGMVRELAMQSELMERNSPELSRPGQDAAQVSTWLLRVERESLRSATHIEKLQAALRTWAQDASLVLQVQAGYADDSPARREVEWAAERQSRAERAVKGSSTVQALLAQFGTARILPGSIRPV
jgi:DNA polymerase-3 subunit gamma/tau